MLRVPIFLNELSYPLIDEDEHVVREKVFVFLRSLAQLQRISPGLVLGCSQKLVDIPITGSYQTVAAIAGGIGRDWWRFLARLDQKNPLSALPGCNDPANMHVYFHGDGVCEGSSWAHANSTLMVSFQSQDRWMQGFLGGNECLCTCGEHPLSAVIEIRNVSQPEHADEHADLLRSYGVVVHGGAIVYEHQDFSLRMPPRDHEPMHVHVCPSDSAFPTFATVRFDIAPEVLAGDLSPSLFRAVSEVLVVHKQLFVDNWSRRRAGDPAQLIQPV